MHLADLPSYVHLSRGYWSQWSFVSFTNVAYTLFTPRFGDQRNQSQVRPLKPLGRRRASLAFLVIASGLLTFFLPLVTTDPAVMGISHWSAWNISSEIYLGNLALKRNDLLSSIPIMPTSVYILLVLALAMLWISPSRDTFKKMAVVGIFTSWFWRGDRRAFEELFYGNFGYQNFSLVRRVETGQLTIVLLVVMGCLLFIATNEDLGRDFLAEKARIHKALSDTGKPEFLDAEILPGEQEVRRPNAISLDGQFEKSTKRICFFSWVMKSMRSCTEYLLVANRYV